MECITGSTNYEVDKEQPKSITNPLLALADHWKQADSVFNAKDSTSFLFRPYTGNQTRSSAKKCEVRANFLDSQSEESLEIFDLSSEKENRKASTLSKKHFSKKRCKTAKQQPDPKRPRVVLSELNVAELYNTDNLDISDASSKSTIAEESESFFKRFDNILQSTRRGDNNEGDSPDNSRNISNETLKQFRPKFYEERTTAENQENLSNNETGSPDNKANISDNKENVPKENAMGKFRLNFYQERITEEKRKLDKLIHRKSKLKRAYRTLKRAFRRKSKTFMKTSAEGSTEVFRLRCYEYLKAAEFLKEGYPRKRVNYLKGLPDVSMETYGMRCNDHSKAELSSLERSIESEDAMHNASSKASSEVTAIATDSTGGELVVEKSNISSPKEIESSLEDVLTINLNTSEIEEIQSGEIKQKTKIGNYRGLKRAIKELLNKDCLDISKIIPEATDVSGKYKRVAEDAFLVDNSPTKSSILQKDLEDPEKQLSKRQKHMVEMANMMFDSSSAV